MDVPTQEVPWYEKVGVTTIFPVMGAAALLVAVNERFPLPKDESPILVLSFVQLYVVVPTVFIVPKVTVVGDVLHTTWLAG